MYMLQHEIIKSLGLYSELFQYYDMWILNWKPTLACFEVQLWSIDAIVDKL